MRRLLLLRHGLTAWNAEARWQGHADIELTEAGHLQAKAAAAAIAAYAPAYVVASDLRRAATTAEYVATACAVTATYDSRLREIHVGGFSGLTGAEVLERFGPGPYDHGHHGGESDAELLARFLPALREAVDRLGPGETGVVVSHGSSLRLGLCGFLGWPIETVATLGALDNCGWIILEERVSSTTSAAGWRLAAYNRVAPIS